MATSEYWRYETVPLPVGGGRDLGVAVSTRCQLVSAQLDEHEMKVVRSLDLGPSKNAMEKTTALWGNKGDLTVEEGACSWGGRCPLAAAASAVTTQPGQAAQGRPGSAVPAAGADRQAG
jgi:hypothetical protein